jgi:hypothetical protein
MACCSAMSVDESAEPPRLFGGEVERTGSVGSGVHGLRCRPQKFLLKAVVFI